MKPSLPPNSSTSVAAVRTAVAAMVDHPQRHHGWGTFYQCLDHALGRPRSVVAQLAADALGARPLMGLAHLATLLGATTRMLAAGSPVAAVFDPTLPVAVRADLLEEVFGRHADTVASTLRSRSNSFSCARRFLVPQLVIGAYVASHGLRQVSVLDIGTGLGLIPRQLNHRESFDRFARDLKGSDILPYHEIPIYRRHGVDTPPLPDLAWVRHCHGPSSYYEQRFDELLWAHHQTAHVSPSLEVFALDLLDEDQVTSFFSANTYEIVIGSFVLYESASAARRRIVNRVVESLAPQGIFVSMEPTATALTRQGCQVHVYVAGTSEPMHLFDVSDGHFMGRLTPGTDWAAFASEHLQRGSG